MNTRSALFLEPDAAAQSLRSAWTRLASTYDVERLRRLIIERHLADFERGNLVSVRGWVMSDTEVALYALVALEERSSV